MGVGVTWLAQRFTDLNWTYYFPCSFGITFAVGYLASLCARDRVPAPALTIWDRPAR